MGAVREIILPGSKVMGAILGFGGGQSASPMPMPQAPPIAPPAYTQPLAAEGAGNISQSAKAAGAFANTVITGPEGLTKPETTSNKQLLGA